MWHEHLQGIRVKTDANEQETMLVIEGTLLDLKAASVEVGLEEV